MRFLCEFNTGKTKWGIRQRVQREREREIADWGERERTEMMRENDVGFKRRSTLVDFDRWSKSTHKYFWISQIAGVEDILVRVFVSYDYSGSTAFA
jgi:hypothetical protein